MSAFHRLWSVITLLALVVSPIWAGTWRTDIKPGARDNFTRADFSLWLPDASAKPRALLVLCPGWNGDGRDWVNDKKWQAFAGEQRLGLIGVCLQSHSPDDDDIPYHVAQNGSGAALLKAIAQLASLANHPMLADSPLLIWGHSAGGQFGYGMACYKPDRVMAFAAIKGGVYLSTPSTDTYQVPGLFIVGEQDNIGRAMNITWLFETGRIKKAPWCLAFEPNHGHEQGDSNDLILPFFKGVLALQQATGNTHTRPKSDYDGWIGVRSSLQLMPARNSVKLPPQRTVWLPDQGSALKWASFSAGAP